MEVKKEIYFVVTTPIYTLLLTEKKVLQHWPDLFNIVSLKINSEVVKPV